MFNFPKIDPQNMTARTYAVATRVTAIYPKDDALPYLSLGLCSEVAELLDALLGEDRLSVDLQKESGDVLWYSFRLLDELFLTHEYPDDWREYTSGDPTTLSEMVRAAGNIAGFVKKAIRDSGGVIPDDDRANEIKAEIFRVVSGIASVTSGEGVDMKTVAAANIAKLLDRRNRGVIGGSGDNR